MNIRGKGQEGEREFCRVLKEELSLGYDLTRNLEQTRIDGGADIIGMKPFSIEVKRQEVLNLKSWWEQSVSQSEVGTIPIVAFRQNRKKWRILVPFDPVPGSYCEVTLKTFVNYASFILETNTLECGNTE